MLYSRKLRSAVLILLGALSISAYAAEESIKKVVVPAGPLTSALKALAEQSGVEFLYSSDQLEGMKTQGVQGEYTTEKAVLKLLEGTKLKLTRHASGALVITMPEAAAAGPSSTRNTLRLAQSDIRSASQGEGRGEATTDSNGKEGQQSRKKEVVEELIVTGSRLRSGGAGASPVILLTEEHLARTGEPTLGRAIRQLPQLNQSQSDIAFTDLTTGNITGADTVVLRGIGLDSTLTLVNGRRIAKTGFTGAFTDISAIPSSAVERVEILADGASAIYGADAIGGVVNFILKKDLSESELGGRYAFADNYDERAVHLSNGFDWGGGGLLLALEHYEQSQLVRADRTWVSDTNHTTVGGLDFRSTASNPGVVTALDGNLDALSALVGRTVATAVAPAGQSGVGLTPAAFIPTAGQTARFDTSSVRALVPEQVRDGLFLMLRQTLSEHLVLEADVIGSRREDRRNGSFSTSNVLVPAANPFNPFGEPVRVAYAFVHELRNRTESNTDTYDVNVGIRGEWTGWDFSVDASVGEDEYRRVTSQLRSLDLASTNPIINPLQQTDPASALNVFGDGTANPASIGEQLTGFNVGSGIGRISSLEAVVRGEALSVPAGLVGVVVGAARRNESVRFKNELQFLNLPVQSRSGSREVSSVFAEVKVPILGQSPSLLWRRLDLYGAVRYEDYSDFGGSTVPKIGLSWQPLDAVRFRASWGRSFKAPFLRDLVEPVTTIFSSGAFFDPKRNEPANLTLIQGGNPALGPETAEHLTVGADLSWRSAKFSLTYFDIDYRDRVLRPGTTEVLANEQLFPGLITRAPPLPSDPAGRPGPIAVFDLRPHNFAITKTSGFDLQFESDLSTPVGQWSLYGNVNHPLHFEEASTPGVAPRELAGAFRRLPTWRLAGGIDWTRGRLGAGLNLQWNSGFTWNPTVQGVPGQDLSSYGVANVRAHYMLESGGLNGLEFSAGIQNVLDSTPPRAANLDGFDPQTADPRGRLIYLQVNRSW